MRFVVCVICCAFSAFLSPSRSAATTFILPLNGLIEITGDIPSPISVTFEVTVNPILPISQPPDGQVPGFSFGISLQQSVPDIGFVFPQVCIGATCGTFVGFGGCGVQIGCGFLFPLGVFNARQGIPVSIPVSDSSRLFGFSGSLVSNIPLDFQFTVDVPDALGIGILDSKFTVVPLPQTPLPGALPLFASGLGALGLLGWRRKWKVRASFGGDSASRTA